MPRKPSEQEYEWSDDGQEVKHVPTGIRIYFPYPDQEGPDRAASFWRGDEGEYLEAEVVDFGARLLQRGREKV